MFCFQKTAGLRVNLEKSSLFGVGKDRNLVESMVAIIGCKPDQMPSTFLGLPVGESMGSCKHWKNLIDKFKKKLSSWKIKTLSIGGRHTIASNVLGSLGTYMFSLFKAPGGILKILEGLRRKFFWGGDEEQRKIPWIKWDKVTSDKKKGGLGIGSLRELNMALLSKWCWRYKTEKEALWVKVVDSIHGKDSIAKGYKEINCGHNWRRIVQQWDELQEEDLDPRMLIKKQVRNGKNTSFWMDWWTEDKPLRKKYPRLFNLEIRKEITVEEKLNNNRWSEDWKKNFRDGRSKEELEILVKNMESFTLTDGDDKWVCPEGPKKRFEVAWMRQKIGKKTPGATGKKQVG